MTAPNTLIAACPEIEPLAHLANLELVGPNAARLRGLVGGGAVRQAKLEVVQALAREPECVFLFPDDPSNLVDATLNWARIDSTYWRIASPSADVYRELFILGGWLATVGGRRPPREEVGRHQVNTPAGLLRLVEVARADRAIYSLEDDVQWIIAWK